MELRQQKASSRVYKEFYKANKHNTKSFTIKYMPWILNNVARKVKASRGVMNYEQALSAALLASIQAEKRYDESKGSFLAFAMLRINGAIINEFRSIPTKGIELRKKLSTYIETYQKGTGMLPTEDLILAELCLTQQQYRTFCESSTSPKFIDIDDTVVVSDTNSVLFEEIIEIIRETNDMVAVVLEKILVLEYTFKQCAKDLGLKVSVVEEIFNQALPDLQGRLENADISLDDYYATMVNKQQF